MVYKDMVRTNIPLYRKIDGLRLNLYYYYKNSNLNRARLKEASKISEHKVILPTQVGGTRWVSHLKRAVENF